MAAPVYSVLDYFWQFQRLLPRGWVWHRGWGTLQAQHLLTLMPTWARLHQRANEVQAETFPCTVAAEMLPEWEATLGLPDCGPLGTVQERAAAVCAKFAMRGGQSIPYYLELLAAHGYDDITIDESGQGQPFRVDVNHVGDALYGGGSIFSWSITAPSTPIVFFAVGRSTVGEPLASWGDDQLYCLINKYKPAHTVVSVRYANVVSVWDAGGSTWDGGSSTWDQWR
jgi:uncharacterized protein YmfQ (DUF2313 family)